jgi:hypothetical protein
VLKRHRPLESLGAMKVACQVREGAVGKGLSRGSTSLAAYFNSARGRAAYKGKGSRRL